MPDREYVIIQKLCPKCNKEFDWLFGVCPICYPNGYIDAIREEKVSHLIPLGPPHQTTTHVCLFYDRHVQALLPCNEVEVTDRDGNKVDWIENESNRKNP